MILLDQKRFELLPAGVFYITVPNNTDPSTAMITNPLQVKGNTLEGGGDVWEGNLSFQPTEQDTGEDQWPCIGNVYDEEKGFSESMGVNLTLTRGGLIGEEGLTFIVFEPSDLNVMEEWIKKSISAMNAWLKEQPAKYPEIMKAVDATFNDEDFK